MNIKPLLTATAGKIAVAVALTAAVAVPATYSLSSSDTPTAAACAPFDGQIGPLHITGTCATTVSPSPVVTAAPTPAITLSTAPSAAPTPSATPSPTPTATPTPSPTPTPVRTATPTPAPGGFPTADTTGVTDHSVALTVYPGNMAVAAGKTLAYADIRGTVTLAPGATLRQSKVRCVGDKNWCVYSAQGGPITLDHVDIGGGADGTTYNTAIGAYSGGPNNLFEAVHIHYVSDGMRTDGGTTVQDSLIDNLIIDQVPGVHSDGSQTEQASQPIIFRHNSITGGTYTAIYLEHVGSQPVTIDDNLLLANLTPGVSQTAFGVVVPHESGHITVTNNVFSASWLVAPYSVPDGSTVSGNTNTNGKPI